MKLVNVQKMGGRHQHPIVLQVLPGMTREVAGAGGGMLNLCSQDVLLELLRFLKRAYWPFAWDSSGGPESGGEAVKPSVC